MDTYGKAESFFIFLFDISDGRL